jgi:type 2 lantibiotic biosynthesis protein LanM
MGICLFISDFLLHMIFKILGDRGESMSINQLNKLDMRSSYFLIEREFMLESNITTDLGMKKYKKWLEFMQDDTDILSEYILHNELNKESFLSAISNKKFSPKEDKHHKDWMDVLELVLTAKYQEVVLPKAFIKNSQEIPFLNFIIPFLKVAYSKFQIIIKEKFEKDYKKLIDENIESELLLILASSLGAASMRTLILEMNVARVSNLLKGDTGEERYKYYDTEMLKNSDYFNGILSEYIVLSRLISCRVVYWVENTTKLIKRFLEDYNFLKEKKVIENDNDRLYSISMGGNVSDSHKCGQSVGILTLSSGKKIVYKPRNLEIDNKFNMLLDLLNTWGVTPNLKGIPTYNREDYGWVEFIKHYECESNIQVESFYKRIGSYLAILYSLNAVDFHFENIIASGDYPYLVDLESLLHNNSRFFNEDDSAYNVSYKKMYQSVVNIGLLPRKSLSKEDGIDLSGIGGRDNQILPIKSAVITNKLSDKMQISRENISIGHNVHRPKINGEYANADDYSHHIIEGFAQTYNIITQNKEEYINCLKSWKDVEVRQILRPTQRYGSILGISLHPDFLRDGIDRDLIIDKLWLDTINYPDLKKVFNSEKKDMYQLDIPYFSTKPQERHLWDSRGEVIYDFFKNDSLSITIKKVEAMCDSDCREQLNLVKSTMLYLDKGNKEKKKSKNINPESSITTSEKDFLEEAIEIGKRLKETMIIGEQPNGETDAWWIGGGYADEKEGDWNISPVNHYLYDGISGITLFFAYLGYITQREDFTDVAKRCVNSMLNNKQQLTSLGAYNGGGALIYVYNHLHTLWGDNIYLDYCMDIVKELESLIDNDEALDVLSGVAGYALVLDQLYSKTKDSYILYMIEKCGDRLLDSASEYKGGLGWKVPVAPQPLVGFSHGSSGIIYSLCRIANATGKEKYIHAVERTLTFEKQCYREDLKNWIDVDHFQGKTEENLRIMPAAWCHGAPGVLLSRLLTKDFIAHMDFEKDIEIGIETTLKYGFGRDHSLCHGDMGSLDILLIASQSLKDKELTKVYKTYEQHVLMDIRKQGWLSGLPKLNESPGMMVGLAGIGLQLLRSYKSEAIPSVLALQGPKN